MRTVVFLGAILCSLLSQSATYIGTLINDHTQLKLATGNAVYSLEGGTQVLEHTRSLVKFDTFVKVTGKQIGEKTIELDQAPLIQSGNSERKGKLTKTSAGYFLNTLPVKFAQARPCFDTYFDEKSLAFYEGKDVHCLGIDNEDHYLITAMIEQDLYCLDSWLHRPPTKAEDDAQKKPMRFLSSSIFRSAIAEEHASFRLTVKESSQPPKTALIVSLGGRTGDDFEALGGHITLGEATVAEDGNLSIEMFNFYPRFQEKHVIPGFTHFIDYFGGLTTGQTNYRPNFTLVLYDVSGEKIAKIKDVIGEALHYMRSNSDPFGLTFNCAVSFWVALNAAGIKASHHKKHSHAQAPYYPDGALELRPNKYAWFNALTYAHTYSVAEIFPRLSYESFLKSMTQFNASRIDFIFHQQISSNRPQGGAPLRTITDGLWLLYMQNLVNSNHPLSKKTRRWVSKMIQDRFGNDGVKRNT